MLKESADARIQGRLENCQGRDQRNEAGHHVHLSITKRLFNLIFKNLVFSDNESLLSDRKNNGQGRVLEYQSFPEIPIFLVHASQYLVYVSLSIPPLIKG